MLGGSGLRAWRILNNGKIVPAVTFQLIDPPCFQVTWPPPVRHPRRSFSIAPASIDSFNLHLSSTLRIKTEEHLSRGCQ